MYFAICVYVYYGYTLYYYISQFFSHIIVHMIYACIHHHTQVSTIFHTFWLYFRSGTIFSSFFPFELCIKNLSFSLILYQSHTPKYFKKILKNFYSFNSAFESSRMRNEPKKKFSLLPQKICRLLKENHYVAAHVLYQEITQQICVSSNFR